MDNPISPAGELTPLFRFLRRALPIAMTLMVLASLLAAGRLALALGKPLPGFAMMWRKEVKAYTVSYATPSHWPGLAPGKMVVNDHILCVEGYHPNPDAFVYELNPVFAVVDCAAGARRFYNILDERFQNGQHTITFTVGRKDAIVTVTGVPLVRFTPTMLAELLLPSLLLGLGFLAVGAVVYRANPSTEINLTFAAFTTMLAGPMIDQNSPLRLQGLMENMRAVSLLLSVPWLPLLTVTFFHFVNLLTVSGPLTRLGRRLTPLYFTVAVAAALIGVVAFVLDDHPVSVYLLALFGLITAGSVVFVGVWGVTKLVWTYRKSTSRRVRRQTGLVMLGLVVMLGFVVPMMAFFVGDLLLPSYVQGLNYLGLSAAAIFAYATLRYQLFATKSRTLTSLLLLVFCVLMANTLYLLIGQQTSFLPILGASLLTGFALEARRGPTTLLNRLLRREILDYQSVVAFSQQVARLQSTDNLVNRAGRSLQKDLDAEQVEVWLLDIERKTVEHLRDGQPTGITPLPPGLAGVLLAHPDPIHANSPASASFGPLLAGNDDSNCVALWAPLVERGQAVGILGLGPRWTGELYDDQDHKLVGILARQMALAILNTRQWERLQATSQLVQQAEENERRKIARELHDTILPFLLVLTYGLDGLKERQMASSGDIVGELERWQDRISAEAGQLRSLLNYLRAPELLVQQGLIRSLQTWLDGVQQETTIEIVTDLNSDVESLLSTEAKVAVYRTVREAVHNALKHSGGSRVVARLIREDDHMAFTVEDDGRGFDVAQAGQGSEKGYSSLLDMRLHMESVGGEVEVRSEVGKGTVVRGWAPVFLSLVEPVAHSVTVGKIT